MAVTYFGLLPNEILRYCIKPRLDPMSLVMLRHTYLGRDIPDISQLLQTAFDDDSVEFVNYLMLQRKITLFYEIEDDYLLLQRVRSTEMASLLVNNFRNVISLYLRKIDQSFIDTRSKIDIRQRRLFGQFIDETIAPTNYITRRNNIYGQKIFVDVILEMLIIETPSLARSMESSRLFDQVVALDSVPLLKIMLDKGILGLTCSHLNSAINNGCINVVRFMFDVLQYDSYEQLDMCDKRYGCLS